VGGGVRDAIRAQRVRLHLSRPATDVVISIRDSQGHLVIECDTRLTSPLDDRRNAPSDTISCLLSDLHLVPGRYYLTVTVLEGTDLVDYIENVARFDVGEAQVGGRFMPLGSKGAVTAPHVWSFE
jgi:hypothetical protein